MRHSAFFLVVVLAVPSSWVAPAVGVAAEPAPRRHLILDSTAYWRFHLVGGPARISPEVMKAEGAKYLKPRHLARMKARAMNSLKKAGKDPQTWYKTLAWNPVFVAHRLLNGVRTQDPPANWADPSFDASDWTRAKRPFLMDVPFGADGARGRPLNIVRGCYRTYFDVADPAKVNGLMVHLVYRGGVRVFVNGVAVGRGHLPAGVLKPDTPARPYPAEAYYAFQDEIPPDQRGKDLRSKLPARKEYRIAKETRGTFERLRLYKGQKKDAEYRDMGWDYHYGGCSINKKGFDRLLKLRNRTRMFAIPAKLLRKGANLLAIDLRGSHLHPLAVSWGGRSYDGTANWDHTWMMDLTLTADAPVGSSPAARPSGAQVWVEDIHTRVFGRDFCSDPVLPREATIVGPRNGTFGAQIVVGTDAELKGLTIRVGAFKGPAGELPASVATVRFMQPHAFWDIRGLGEGKGGGMSSKPGPASMSPVILRRYYSADERKKAGRNRAPLLKDLTFFDHLTPRALTAVPANSARALWLSVRAPADAAPGTYHSTVTVRADGLDPASVNVRLDVLDWRLPDPQDFRTIMAIEQSPYAIARHYEVAPWSDEHFRRMESSFKRIARAGGDFLGIPVLLNSEFGNRGDSPLRITRKKDGSLHFDFRIVDRYIDLAAKHCGVPQCICFLVSHSGGSAEKPTLKIRDEATGKDERMYVGTGLAEPERRRVWRAVASAIYLHMRERGLHRSLRWGLIWDYVGLGDESLILLLKEFTPSVTWVRYSHRNPPNATYSWCATVRGGGLHLRRPTLKGWKSPSVNLVISRNYNDVWSAYGSSLPYACRVGPERALASGGRGIGRIGADYWNSTWCDGHKPPGFTTGMPYLSLLWPGTEGADSSVRYEVMLEGLQEAEARVFLEQAMEKLKDAALARKVSAVLDAHFSATLLMPCMVPHPLIEEHASGWQRRSRQLYEAAAEVAGRIGVDFDTSVISRQVPAFGKPMATLKLRNWTSKPREWKLVADVKWIVPKKTSGKATAQPERLPVALDATQLKPGKTATGKLTLTDVATGRTETVAVIARVNPVCTFATPEPAANVDVGASAKKAYTLLNGSAADLKWTLRPSVAWITAMPARGKLGPSEQTGITLTITPPDKTRARHEVTLRLTGSPGYAGEQKLVVHVLPPYQAPAAAPTGVATPMQEFPKSFFKPHRDRKNRPVFPAQFWDPKNPRAGMYNHWPSKRGVFAIGVKTEKDKRGRPALTPLKRYERGFGATPGHQVICLPDGHNVTAFSADVGWMYGSLQGPTDPRLHFEVYVDGRFAAHSHLMKNGEPARRIQVSGLDGAKEIKLVTRLHTDARSAPGRKVYIYAVWGDPTFYVKR